MEHTPNAEAGAHGAARIHIAPPRALLAVWGALAVLTVLTVTVAGIDLGKFNLWAALAIATTKAGLVALYFMHLRYDRPFHGFLFVCALAFAMLLAGLALMDAREYRPELIPGYAPAIHK